MFFSSSIVKHAVMGDDLRSRMFANSIPPDQMSRYKTNRRSYKLSDAADIKVLERLRSGYEYKQVIDSDELNLLPKVTGLFKKRQDGRKNSEYIDRVTGQVYRSIPDVKRVYQDAAVKSTPIPIVLNNNSAVLPRISINRGKGASGNAGNVGNNIVMSPRNLPPNVARNSFNRGQRASVYAGTSRNAGTFQRMNVPLPHPRAPMQPIPRNWSYSLDDLVSIIGFRDKVEAWIDVFLNNPGQPGLFVFGTPVGAADYYIDVRGASNGTPGSVADSLRLLLDRMGGRRGEFMMVRVSPDIAPITVVDGLLAGHGFRPAANGSWLHVGRTVGEGSISEVLGGRYENDRKWRNVKFRHINTIRPPVAEEELDPAGVFDVLKRLGGIVVPTTIRRPSRPLSSEPKDVGVWIIREMENDVRGLLAEGGSRGSAPRLSGRKWHKDMLKWIREVQNMYDECRKKTDTFKKVIKARDERDRWEKEYDSALKAAEGLLRASPPLAGRRRKRGDGSDDDNDDENNENERAGEPSGRRAAMRG